MKIIFYVDTQRIFWYNVITTKQITIKFTPQYVPEHLFASEFANTGNLRFRKGDMLAVLLVAALAVFVALCFLPREDAEAVTAEIYQNGELVKTVSLNADTSFAVTGKYTNTVTVRDGKISITQSDCPGEDCVHSGAILLCSQFIDE